MHVTVHVKICSSILVTFDEMRLSMEQKSMETAEQIAENRTALHVSQT